MSQASPTVTGTATLAAPSEGVRHTRMTRAVKRPILDRASPAAISSDAQQTELGAAIRFVASGSIGTRSWPPRARVRRYGRGSARESDITGKASPWHAWAD